MGLSINIIGADQPPVVAGDRSYLVAFSAYWLFAQQLYGLHELYERDAPELNQLVYTGLKDGFGTPESTLRWESAAIETR